MIKCEHGLVEAEGTGKELLIDLICILRTLEEHDFPKEGIEIAVKMAKEDFLHGVH